MSITMANHHMIQNDRRTFSQNAFINSLSPIQTSFHRGDDPIFGAAFSNIVVGTYGRQMVQVASFMYMTVLFLLVMFSTLFGFGFRLTR